MRTWCLVCNFERLPLSVFLFVLRTYKRLAVRQLNKSLKILLDVPTRKTCASSSCSVPPFQMWHRRCTQCTASDPSDCTATVLTPSHDTRLSESGLFRHDHEPSPRRPSEHSDFHAFHRWPSSEQSFSPNIFRSHEVIVMHKQFLPIPSIPLSHITISLMSSISRSLFTLPVLFRKNAMNKGQSVASCATVLRTISHHDLRTSHVVPSSMLASQMVLSVSSLLSFSSKFVTACCISAAPMTSRDCFST